MEKKEHLDWRFDLLVIGLVILFSVITRSVHLGFPQKIYFDETYYNRAAGDYLAMREDSNWVHPPLGKILIAAGIVIHRGFMQCAFAFDPVHPAKLASEWRMGSLICGFMMIPLIYFMALRIIKSRTAAAVAAFLLSIETLNFVQSRIAMIDIFLGFFMLAGAYCAYCYIDSDEGYQPCLLWSAFFFGCAVACKWSGLFGAFGACVSMILLKDTVREKEKLGLPGLAGEDMAEKGGSECKKPHPLRAILARMVRQVIVKFPRALKMAALFFIVLTGVHALSYIPFFVTGGTVDKFFTNTNGILNFHYKQPWKHPYLSQMWMWPLMIRPIWYFFEESLGKVYGIVAIGSPLFWWGFLIFLSELVIISFYEKKKEAIFLLIGYFAPYIFWIISNKGGFFYYMTPCSAWMCLITAYGLERWKESPWGNAMGWTYLAALLFFFFIFYPILIGYPVPREFFNHLMWTNKWI
jgi:dolichyl-phosphate-mannose--protein O-mannosyl transferase